jgi:hypothetical protein
MRIGLEKKRRGVTSHAKLLTYKILTVIVKYYSKILQENKKRARIIPLDFQWSVKKDVNIVNIKKFQPLDFQWSQKRCWKL